MNNIDKYKKDLKFLIEKGDKLDTSIKYECYPENVENQIKEVLKDEEKTKK